MKKRILYSFFIVSVLGFLSNIYSDSWAQGSDWQLPADNYVSAKMDMTVTHPRPEASSWAYSKNAHPGVRWEIPIVIQGGAWPFRYEIVSNGGASGLEIGSELERTTENEFTVHRVTEEYGVLWWESPVAGSYDILVRVHDQDSNSIDVPVSLTVGTAGWVFVDPATGDDSNDGSQSAPLASIQEIHNRGTAFADHRVYLSGLVPMDGRDENNGNIRVARGSGENTPTPAVWVGMPGTGAVLEAYEGKFVIDSPDFYMANLEHRHHEDFYQDHGSFIHMFTVWSNTPRLTLHDIHFSRFQGNPNNHNLGNSSIIMFTNFDGNEGRKHIAIVNNTQSGDNGIFTSTYQLRYSVIEKNRGVGTSFDLADSAVWAIFWIKGHSTGGSNEYITIRANEMWDNNTWSTNGNLSSAAGMLRARNIEFSYNTLHTPYSALRKGAIGIGDHGTKSDYTWTEDTPVWLYRNSLKQKIYWGGLNYANMPDDNIILERNVLDTGTWPTHDFLLNIENLDTDTYFDSQMKLTGSARSSYLGRYGAEIAVQDGGGGSSDPVASFSYSPDENIETGQQIDFTDTSTDSDGSVTGWSWDFGDGATSSDQNPSHTYSQAGDYTVSLTVTDNEENDSTPTTVSITIIDPGEQPDKVFHVDAQALSTSDGEALSDWTDLSGEGNNVSGSGTYVEASNINGYPAVRFDGDDDMFETTISETATEYTLFIVKQVDDETGQYDASFSSTTGLFTPYGFQLDYRNDMMTHASVGTEGGVSDNLTLEIGQRSEDPVIMTVRANGTITQGWLMGVESSATVARGQGGFDRFRIGESRSGNNHMKGDIGEVLVYFRALSDTERAQVEQDLMDKWGFGDGGPVEGSDQRVMAGNQSEYVFSSGDFGDAEGQYSVKIQSLPDAGELLGGGDPLTAGTVVTAGQLAGGHLSWAPPAGEHGYGFTSLSFSLQEDTRIPPPPPPPGSEPEEPSSEDGEVYTLAIDLAAGAVELTGGEGWRFLTIPADGASYADLLDPVWTQGVPGADDAGAGPASVLVFDQQAFEWTPVGGLDQPAGPGEAFIAYILSDDDADGSPEGFPKTLSAGQSWAPLDGSFTYSGLEYDPDPEGINPNNVYLVGNPHPVSVDYCAMVEEASQMSTALWVWDPAAGGGQGDYRSLNCATESELAIAPFQGVWVRTAGANPSLGVPTEAYMGQTESGYFKQDNAKSVESPEHLTLQVTSGDEVFANRVDLLFTPEGTLGMDRFDAPKLSPAGLADRWVSFYALDEQGQTYSFRSLPQSFEGEQLVIPMDIRTTEQGTFTLSWERPQGIRMNYWLRDTKTGRQMELSEGGRYSFEVEPPTEAASQTGSQVAVASMGKSPSQADARFELVAALGSIGGPGSPGDLPDQIRLQQNYPNPFNPTTVIGYELPSNSQVRLDVYDITGRHVATLVDRQVAAGRHQVNFDASDLSSGVYLYRLQAGATIQTQKLTIIK